MSAIRAVWIDVNCIGCNACANDLPTVFAQPEGRAEILASVRVDGCTSDNEAEKSELNGQGQLLREEILEAAAGCPVDAIKVALAP